MCVCVCCNKNRVIGVTGPPKGRMRAVKEGGSKGQNEKEEVEEEEQMKFFSQQLSPQRPCHV